jgi:DNA-directed RNA polymerase sigma subunit (sigma70/sigma32)
MGLTMDIEEVESNARKGLMELIRSSESPNAKLKAEAERKLVEYIQLLDPEDIEFAALRFGLANGHPWTHEELSAETGVSVELIAATEARILECMSDRKKGFLWPKVG